jgi:hypothetical protein
MKRLRTASLLACMALVAACGRGEAASEPVTALTEPQVRAFLDRFEASAYTEREDEVMGAALADDASIVWRTPGEPDESMDKEEFLSDVVGIENQQYHYEIGDIVVAPGGQSATAAVTANDSFEVEGVKYEIAYDQDYRIELRDGVPLIVSLVGEETALTIDGEKQY